MARKLIKRFLPDPKWIRQQKSLNLLGNWTHDPNLWHLTRHSAATAAFIGLFLAFMPVPAQMMFAVIGSMLFRANLPMAVTLVWITNPFTIAPIFYLAYKVGVAVMGVEAEQFNFELSWHWLQHGFVVSWQPFILGCLLCGMFFGLLGSTLIRWYWRMTTMRRWHERKAKRESE
ncbi:MAG: hypothetical protein ACJAYG_001614 [Oceanicoccus sp.]|jgi:uncharacterized protein (DUF2062 family)